MVCDSIINDIIPNENNTYSLGTPSLEFNNIYYGLTALTGCAAVLINGQTIHSFLGLGISRDLKTIIKKAS